MSRRAALGLLVLTACGGPDRPARPARAATSKASLYGDASLVPTRAGEHARAELALSAELQRVIETPPGILRVTVSVRLPAAPIGRSPRSHSAPTRAVVSVTVAPEVDVDATRYDVAALADTWLGPNAAVQTLITRAPAPPSPDPLPLPMLAFALLGLGATAGVTVDRAFDRRRRRIRRARPPHRAR